MNKISLMTLSMYMRIFFKFNLDHDIEDLKDGYEEMMDMVQSAGYDAVDVTQLETQFLGADYVLDVLRRHHLTASSYISFGQFASADEDGFEDRIMQAKQGADTACRLGADVWMLVPQAHDQIGENAPEQLHAQMIRHWKEITPYAKEKGLHVVVEDTPDLKLHFCMAKDVQEVLDAVPGLELVYDSGNMVLVGEDPAKYLDMFRDKIGYVHLKDMRRAPADAMMPDFSQDGTPMTSAPTGTGLVDLKAVTKKLKAIGYEGRMTVEFSVDDDKDYIKSLIRSREFAERIAAGE